MAGQVCPAVQFGELVPQNAQNSRKKSRIGRRASDHGPRRALEERDPFEIFAKVPPPAIHNWRLNIRPAMQLWRQIGTVQGASTTGDLKVTRKGNHALSW